MHHRLPEILQRLARLRLGDCDDDGFMASAGEEAYLLVKALGFCSSIDVTGNITSIGCSNSSATS